MYEKSIVLLSRLQNFQSREAHQKHKGIETRRKEDKERINERQLIQEIKFRYSQQSQFSTSFYVYLVEWERLTTSVPLVYILEI